MAVVVVTKTSDEKVFVYLCMNLLNKLDNNRAIRPCPAKFFFMLQSSHQSSQWGIMIVAAKTSDFIYACTYEIARPDLALMLTFSGGGSVYYMYVRPSLLHLFY